MSRELHDYFGWLRWSMSDQEAREARLLSAKDWHTAWLVGAAILLAGLLVLGLMWLAQRDAKGWTKQERAYHVGQGILMPREDLID